METLKDALKAIYSSIPTKVTITNLTMNGHCQSCRRGWLLVPSPPIFNGETKAQFGGP